MDFFGIGQAIKGAIRIYFQSARGSGRTTSLVEGVKNGDRICFTNQREAERVQRLCKERGVDIKYIIVDPRKPESVFNHGSVPGEGRNIFDHSWVEEYYMNVITKAQEQLTRLEQQTSGYSAKHRETRRKVIELSKWNI